MKKFKKILTVLILFVVLLSFAGCVGGDGEYFASGISSDAFDGIKVTYIASDESSNQKLTEYYEKFSINILGLLWGNYGTGMGAGDYSVAGGQVINEGGYATTVTFEEIVPQDNADLQTYPYATNKNAIFKGVYEIDGQIIKAVTWNLNGGFNPNSTDADFLTYANMHYQQVTKYVFYSILNLSSEEISIYEQMDYAIAVKNLAGRIDHFGFLTLIDTDTLDEQDRIVINLTNLFLQEGTTYVRQSEQSVYIESVKANIMTLDENNRTDTTNYLFKNYVQNFAQILYAAMQDTEQYFVSPKVYVLDLAADGDGLEKPPTEQYVSYVYMPKRKVYFEYVTYQFQQVQQGDKLDIAANFNLCENINDEGTASSKRNYISFDFASYVGKGVSEAANEDFEDFDFYKFAPLKNYLRYGLQLVLRKFINNTPASEQTLVGFDNDYNDYYNITLNESGVGCKINYSDASTDFYELGFTISGSGNHKFYADEMVAEYK